MVKFSIIKVDHPNSFLGKDLSIFEKVNEICDKIKNSDCKILPCSQVVLQKIYLADRCTDIVRIRVLSAINSNTFKCLLIDHGEINEIRKQRIYNLPLNQLDIDPAVKMIKIPGIRPSGMNMIQSGANIQMKKGEVDYWVPASYKFVSRIFEEHNVVYVNYLKQLSKDKMYADVNVIYGQQRENLKDLLITEEFAVLSKDEINNSDSSITQQEMGDVCDTESNYTVDSLENESISNIIDNLADDLGKIAIVQQNPLNTKYIMNKMSNSDTLQSTSSIHGTLDELSIRILNIKVKCWSVTKLTTTDESGKSFTEYQYENPIRPITSYKYDPILAPFLKEAMASHETKSLLLIQAYMIPSIVRGVNLVAIAPTRKGKSMGILMPILQTIAMKRLSPTRSCNPLAIILCSSWKKVKNLAESAKIFLKFITEAQKIRKPRLVAAYAGSVEKKSIHPILEGCDILIITPKCLLQWLQQYEFVKLNELEIFCLDDAENIIAEHLETLKAIMVHKRTGAIDSGNEAGQFITATHWTSGLESYVKHEMGNRFNIAVNDPLELAVIERIKQKIIEYDDTEGDMYHKLVAYLELTESSIKRTIIFASDDSEIASVYKYLMQKATVDLKLMTGSMSSEELNLMAKEWNQYRGYVNMPLLLISDEALKYSDISIFNAQILIHVDINELTFGSRLNFLRDKYTELTFLKSKTSKAEIDESKLFNSFIFLCPKTINLVTANFLYKFLGRCDSFRPTWLQEKAIDYILMKEKSKGYNEICPRIKSYGECKLPGCMKRHMVLPAIDTPLLPNRGHIKFRLLHLDSPSHFYVRISEFNTTSDCEVSSRMKYLSLKMKLSSYFSNPQNIHGVNLRLVQVGLIAVIKTKDLLERVIVTKILPGRVWLKLIDHGSEMVAEQADLLHLPKELSAIPPQAIEVYVTGIKPIDNDEYYSEHSCEFAKNFLSGHDLYAIIMLCIGSTLWIDVVTERKHYKATNLTVYDNNLSGALDYENLVDKNPQHIDKLVRLCTGKIDIWKPKTNEESATKPVPIMLKFSYLNLPIVFESLPLCDDDNKLDTECVMSHVLSPNFIILNNRNSMQSAVDLQMQIKSLISSIETLHVKDVKLGVRILYLKDGCWQRGYVIKMSTHIEVFSLDWGVIHKFDYQDSQFKKLPNEYQKLPYQAILCSLFYCIHSCHSYSLDVNSVIEQFAFNHKKKIALVVSTISKESVNCKTFFNDDDDFEFADLDLFHSLNRHNVIICREASHFSDEKLHEVLIRNQSILPSLAWIHEVLPESHPFASRLVRNGSIPHLVADLLSIRDYEKRLKISQTIEKFVNKKSENYISSNSLSFTNIDSLLNALAIMIHFVNEQTIFMCIYRSLNILLHLAYEKHIKVQNDSNPNEEFNIKFIVSILLPYDSISFHMLRHLSICARNDQIENCCVILDNLRMLLLDPHMVIYLFKEKTWYVVMATCVGAIQNDEKLYNILMDILVQLVMLWKSNEPVLAGILQQCCQSFEKSESPSVWNSSLSLISCLINNQIYSPIFRELSFFEILFDRFVCYYNEIGHWSEIHENSLDVLVNMWRNGSVNPKTILKKRCLSKDIDKIRKQNSDNTTLGRFVSDILLEESSVTTVTGLDEMNSMNSVNNKQTTFPSDPDALEWLKGNEIIAKKFRKSYRRVFNNSESESSSDDKNNSLNSDDSDSSDAEVIPFLNGMNPADEDNVPCFEKA